MAHLTSIIVFLSLAITSSEGQVSSNADASSVCSLPKVVGPCRAALKRFFFNTTAGQCEEFTFGGCQGNDNNFNTQDLCNAACPPTDVCEQPKIVGLCRAIIPRYYFNSASGMCEQFFYGGCGANGNNFISLEECNGQCLPTNVCDLPKVVGPCEALFPRYYYNQATQKCEAFNYGGCQGNGNNFERLEDCTKQCQPVNACDQPKVTGQCRGAFPRYYYNSTTNTCEEFTYGGCQGNENNFNTLEDCNAECPCNLPAQPGRCRAYIPSWYFNTESESCESFVYGGCEGNGNRFRDQHTCEDRCGTCSLPMKIGPCDGAFPRWYYNSNTGLCQQFSYGGCEGNANNFESESACKRSCEANSSSFWTYSFGNLF